MFSAWPWSARCLLVMGSGFSTYVIDLKVRTESADRIHQLSFNDTMTGLPNGLRASTNGWG